MGVLSFGGSYSGGGCIEHNEMAASLKIDYDNISLINLKDVLISPNIYYVTLVKITQIKVFSLVGSFHLLSHLENTLYLVPYIRVFIH